MRLDGNLIFTDDEQYSPAESVSGNNAYYNRCEVVGYSSSFAACLQRVKRFATTGKLGQSEQTCASALRCKECPAIAMRKEEMAAGKAIYFLNRRKLNEFIANRDKSSTAIVRQQEWVPPQGQHIVAFNSSRYMDDKRKGIVRDEDAPAIKKTPAVTKPAQPEANDFASAINFAIAQEG